MSESVKDKKSQIGLWLAGAMFCLWYLGYIVIQADTKEGAKGVHLEWETPAVSWQELSQARENETAGSGIHQDAASSHSRAVTAAANSQTR